MHSFQYQNGRLRCEDVDLETLANQHGTPLYVYSSATILDHYRRLDRAMAELDHQICYAVKANSNLAVLNLLAKEGCSFDIVSGGELFRVLKAGGAASKCTFAGVGKTTEEIEQGLREGIHSFNVESEAELLRINEVAQRLNLRAPVAIRVNPNVEAGTHKYISTGKSDNKFGIGIDRIRDVYAAAAKLPHLHLRGVQMHIGSQITKSAPFANAVTKMLPLVADLKRDHGIEFFSIGGGLGIVYHDSIGAGQEAWWKQEESPAITIEEYAQSVVPLLKNLGVKILFEPGRLIVGNAGVLLTRVHYVKQAESKKFVIVDAGMNDLIRPALYQGFHEVVPVRKAEDVITERIDLVGPVCESGDFFAQDRDVSPLTQDAVVALMSAGAYGFAMASNYNSRPRPAEILVTRDKASVVRRRETWDELIAGETTD
ncbi:MAG: diaminopimelate decarboxylase [Chthoniobacterales bacterium]